MHKLQALLKQLNQQQPPREKTDLIILLGPTASGKTRLAVQLAQALDGEIISADSRQVYKQMDIGTGKDLREYQNIPYHLIDILNPGERYQVDQFRIDFFQAYDAIRKRNKTPILCGGTGSYIQSILQDRPYAQVPKDPLRQAELQTWSKTALLAEIERLDPPKDLHIDTDSHKRLVRGLEIIEYLRAHPGELAPQRVVSTYQAFGLNPATEQRRAAISLRLAQRLAEGLIEEVNTLRAQGLSHADLIYYGLEYKYLSYYLQGQLDYTQMHDKLRTEIHRYAKRQMTYFRKMEKDGIPIHWLPNENTQASRK